MGNEEIGDNGLLLLPFQLDSKPLSLLTSLALPSSSLLPSLPSLPSSSSPGMMTVGQGDQRMSQQQGMSKARGRAAYARECEKEREAEIER